MKNKKANNYGVGIPPETVIKGLHKVAVSGNYNDLNNKPDIDGIKSQLDEMERYNKNTKQTTIRPIVTFTSDDSGIDDWNKLKPLSEKHNIPFTIAVITNRTNDQSVRLTDEQIISLHKDLNWEICSHTVNHVHLSRLSDAEAEKEMKDSKTYIEKVLNISCEGILYPFGDIDKKKREIAKKYYRYGAITGLNDGTKQINHEGVPNFFATRLGFGSSDGSENGNNTLEYYKEAVDECFDTNGWLIFMLHPNGLNEEQKGFLDEIISYVKSKNIEIMNYCDGLNIFGNVLEVGDYTQKIAKNEGIAIGCNSNIFNFPVYNIIPKTGINNATLPIDFPKNSVTHTNFISPDNAGFPTYAGTLITDVSSSEPSLYSQLWLGVDGTISRRLYNKINSQWYDWIQYAKKTEVDSIYFYNIEKQKDKYTSQATIGEFPDNKITVSRVGAGNTGGFPGNGYGTLTTYRISTEQGFNKQMFIDYVSNKQYIRCSNGSSWTDWKGVLDESDITCSVKQTNYKKETDLINSYIKGISMFAVIGWTKGNGLVTTYRVGTNQFDKQEFRTSATNSVWSRTTNGAGEWLEWEKISVN